MLQALLKALPQATRGDVGGFSSSSDLQKPSQEAVHTAVVDVGGFGGAARSPNRKPRERRAAGGRIAYWHDLFRHINGSWLKLHGRLYPWNDADRKILANTARKYTAPAVMAMWNLYQAAPGYWHKATAGYLYGMVRDSGRLLDDPKFKPLRRYFENEMQQQYPGLASTGEILGALSLTAKQI
jgi:hypothetical protein